MPLWSSESYSKHCETQTEYVCLQRLHSAGPILRPARPDPVYWCVCMLPQTLSPRVCATAAAAVARWQTLNSAHMDAVHKPDSPGVNALASTYDALLRASARQSSKGGTAAARAAAVTDVGSELVLRAILLALGSVRYGRAGSQSAPCPKATAFLLHRFDSTPIPSTQTEAFLLEALVRALASVACDTVDGRHAPTLPDLPFLNPYPAAGSHHIAGAKAMGKRQSAVSHGDTVVAAVVRRLDTLLLACLEQCRERGEHGGMGSSGGRREQPVVLGEPPAAIVAVAAFKAQQSLWMAHPSAKAIVRATTTRQRMQGNGIWGMWSRTLGVRSMV